MIQNFPYFVVRKDEWYVFSSDFSSGLRRDVWAESLNFMCLPGKELLGSFFQVLTWTETRPDRPSCRIECFHTPVGPPQLIFFRDSFSQYRPDPILLIETSSCEEGFYV